MNTKSFRTLFFLFVFFFALLLAGGEFRIAATTDIHGNLRNLARLAPQIRRASPDLLVDAGDLTGGNLLAELDGGRSMIAALNLLKYDFFVPGNHDFATSQEAFAAMVRSFRGTFLGGDWRWGDTAGVPRKIITKGSFRVGVIGLTEPDIGRRHLPLASSPVFEEWEKVLRAQLKALHREKVHFTVLIWHNGLAGGYSSAERVLRRIPGIDLVIGGHNHKEVQMLRRRDMLMVQPGAHAASASLVTVTYDDRTLEVKKVTAGLLRGTQGKEAPDLAALNKRAVKPYYPQIFRRICRRGDLSFRNFPPLAAEALRRAGKTQGAVMICQRPDRRSASFSQYRDLFRLLPHHDTLCTVTVTREELRALLEDLHKNNPKFRRLTGTAGFRWHPPAGRRPGILEAPPKLTLTVSSYLMTSTPVLRAILREKSLRWRHTGIVERKAVEEFLSSRRR